MRDSAAFRSGPGNPSLVNLALGLAIGAAVLWIVFTVLSVEGPIWLLVGLLGAVAAITGWRSSGGATPRGRALAAVIVGVLAFLSVLVFTIVLAISGDL